MIGIYKIENKINGKKYIGQSKDIEKRWKEHIRDLKNNNHHSWKLQKAWDEYGEDSFKFDIIEAYESLDDKEKYYIDKYNSIDEGYNCVEVGYVPTKINNKALENTHEFNIDLYHSTQINMNNNMIFDEKLMEKDLIIYIVSKINIGFNRCSMISISSICDILDMPLKKHANDIKNSISKLVEFKHIKIFDIGMKKEIDILNVKPNDNFIIYFGKHDGVFNYEYNRYQEYFPIELEYIYNIIKLSKEFNARFKFMRFALCVKKVCNYYDGKKVSFLPYDKVKFFIKDNRTIASYLEVLSRDYIYYENSYINTQGKNCITYIQLKRNISYADFNKYVENEMKVKGYHKISKEYDKERKRNGIKTIKNNIVGSID